LLCGSGSVDKGSGFGGAADSHAIDLCLSDWGERVNLITSVASLVVGAFGASDHAVLAGDPLTVDSEAIAADIGSVPVSTKHNCFGVGGAVRIGRYLNIG
jgi:hypothetical protein